MISKKLLFKWLILACLLVGLANGCAQQSAEQASSASAEPIECEKIVPRELTPEEWNQLESQDVESWIRDVFYDASNVEEFEGSGYSLSSASWETGSYEYAVIYDDGPAFGIDAYYQNDDRVNLIRWLDCVGEPDSFIAQKVQRHTVETLIYLFYPSKGFIVNFSTDDPNPPMITGQNAWLHSVRLVLPTSQAKDLILQPDNRVGTLEGELEYLRLWTGLEDGIIVETELDE